MPVRSGFQLREGGTTFMIVSLNNLLLKASTKTNCVATAPSKSTVDDCNLLKVEKRIGQHLEWVEGAGTQIDTLTHRQYQIMDLVLAGMPSKNSAVDLGIGQRTVENHRAAILHKTSSKSIRALARLALLSNIAVPFSANFLMQPSNA